MPGTVVNAQDRPVSQTDTIPSFQDLYSSSGGRQFIINNHDTCVDCMSCWNEYMDQVSDIKGWDVQQFTVVNRVVL